MLCKKIFRNTTYYPFKTLTSNHTVIYFLTPQYSQSKLFPVLSHFLVSPTYIWVKIIYKKKEKNTKESITAFPNTRRFCSTLKTFIQNVDYTRPNINKVKYSYIACSNTRMPLQREENVHRKCFPFNLLEFCFILYV